MKTAIIDYGSGNLHSARKAFERALHDNAIDGDILLTNDPEIVADCDQIVLPGVGAFADCAEGLKAVDGMWDAINEAVIKKARPFLGICVGTQLMASRGLEKTITPGFDWINGEVREIKPEDKNLKVPQIGWNTLELKQFHPLLENISLGPEGLHAYFVHSYHFVTKNDEEIIATCDYGGDVTAIIGRDNIIGTQFHPEKSQKLGLKFIANFLRWRP